MTHIKLASIVFYNLELILSNFMHLIKVALVIVICHVFRPTHRTDSFFLFS